MKSAAAFALSVLTATVLLSILPVHGETELYDHVFRLHVIAESDSEKDQALKLLVRDAVLECLSGTMENCGSAEEAVCAAGNMTEEIRAAAENCLRRHGAGETVSVELGLEKYPRREYGGAVMPAGVYQSLRVVIGEGQGKNWWCVLYPSACIRFARADEDAYIQAGFTPEEYRIITGAEGKLKIRFRVLEILSRLIGFEY